MLLVFLLASPFAPSFASLTSTSFTSASALSAVGAGVRGAGVSPGAGVAGAARGGASALGRNALCWWWIRRPVGQKKRTQTMSKSCLLPIAAGGESFMSNCIDKSMNFKQVHLSIVPRVGVTAPRSKKMDVHGIHV